MGPNLFAAKLTRLPNQPELCKFIFFNDDENADCRNSLVVIGGREGEIDIPDRSMDVLQHRNAKYVRMFINTLTQPCMDLLQV